MKILIYQSLNMENFFTFSWVTIRKKFQNFFVFEINFKALINKKFYEKLTLLVSKAKLHKKI